MQVHPHAKDPAMPQDAPPEATIAAWIALMRAQQTVLGGVQAALKSAGLPPLDWYDVLLELRRGPAEGLRPYQLEARLLVAQYNLSRLVDRLVAAGLVEKAPCAEDGRGHVLRITPAGRQAQARMWPRYAAALQQHLGAKLAEEEALTLARLLRKLVDQPS